MNSSLPTSPPALVASDLSARYASVMAALRLAADDAGRRVEQVTCCAVSKTASVQAIRQCAALGQIDFAESRVQEAIPKCIALKDCPITWHFIGPVQSNKVRAIAEHFAWVHSITREKIAAKLHHARSAAQPPLNVCIQVKVAADTAPHREGVDAEDCLAFCAKLSQYDRLQLRGLMCILPPAVTRQGEGAQRAAFAEIAALKREVVARGFAVDTLSMGMSADYPAAIAEGATIVRIGTAIFAGNTHANS